MPASIGGQTGERTSRCSGDRRIRTRSASRRPRFPSAGDANRSPGPEDTSSSARCNNPSDTAKSPTSGVQPCGNRDVSSESQLQSTRLKMACASGINFRMAEVLPAGQNPAQQYGGVHRRHFRIPYAPAGIEIRPMIEEAAVDRHVLPRKRNPANTRPVASARDTKPRCCPMHRAVKPNPVAARLATVLLSGARTFARSRTRPVWGFACSQKNRKLACSSSFRKGSSAGVRRVGAGGGAWQLNWAGDARKSPRGIQRNNPAPAIHCSSSRRESFRRLRSFPSTV